MDRRFRTVIGLMVWLLGTAALVTPAWAACLDDGAIAALAADIAARRPVAEAPQGLTAADARCSQDRLLRRLGVAGAGYKVALTTPAMQAMFGTDGPVWGVLPEGAVMPDGEHVKAGDGARLAVEPDLLVRIGRAGVEQAKTVQEAAAYVSDAIPFIELPDLTFAAGAKVDAQALAAVNAGARLGVAGTPVPFPQAPDAVAALAAMEVSFSDGTGEPEVAAGAVMMGHPLQPLLWLAPKLAAAGRPLRPGDLVSLGSFVRLRPVVAGRTYSATYRGLWKTPLTVRVVID